MSRALAVERAAAKAAVKEARDVADMVGPGTPPLGHPPGLTPARASLPRGLTPDPGAAHGGEDGPHPGPHPPTPGTAHGGNDPKQGSCSRWKGE